MNKDNVLFKEINKIITLELKKNALTQNFLQSDINEFLGQNTAEFVQNLRNINNFNDNVMYAEFALLAGSLVSIRDPGYAVLNELRNSIKNYLNDLIQSNQPPTLSNALDVLQQVKDYISKKNLSILNPPAPPPPPAFSVPHIPLILPARPEFNRGPAPLQNEAKKILDNINEVLNKSPSILDKFSENDDNRLLVEKMIRFFEAWAKDGGGDAANFVESLQYYKDVLKSALQDLKFKKIIGVSTQEEDSDLKALKKVLQTISDDIEMVLLEDEMSNISEPQFNAGSNKILTTPSSEKIFMVMHEIDDKINLLRVKQDPASKQLREGLIGWSEFLHQRIPNNYQDKSGYETFYNELKNFDNYVRSLESNDLTPLKIAAQNAQDEIKKQFDIQDKPPLSLGEEIYNFFSPIGRLIRDGAYDILDEGVHIFGVEDTGISPGAPLIKESTFERIRELRSKQDLKDLFLALVETPKDEKDQTWYERIEIQISNWGQMSGYPTIDDRSKAKDFRRAGTYEPSTGPTYKLDELDWDTSIKIFAQKSLLGLARTAVRLPVLVGRAAWGGVAKGIIKSTLGAIALVAGVACVFTSGVSRFAQGVLGMMTTEKFKATPFYREWSSINDDVLKWGAGTLFRSVAPLVEGAARFAAGIAALGVAAISVASVIGTPIAGGISAGLSSVSAALSSAGMGSVAPALTAVNTGVQAVSTGVSAGVTYISSQVSAGVAMINTSVIAPAVATVGTAGLVVGSGVLLIGAVASGVGYASTNRRKEIEKFEKTNEYGLLKKPLVKVNKVLDNSIDGNLNDQIAKFTRPNQMKPESTIKITSEEMVKQLTKQPLTPGFDATKHKTTALATAPVNNTPEPISPPTALGGATSKPEEQRYLIKGDDNRPSIG